MMGFGFPRRHLDRIACEDTSLLWLFAWVGVFQIKHSALGGLCGIKCMHLDI